MAVWSISRGEVVQSLYICKPLCVGALEKNRMKAFLLERPEVYPAFYASLCLSLNLEFFLAKDTILGPTFLREVTFT